MKRLLIFVLGMITVASLCGQTVWEIGDTGPAGGLIFHDKGEFSDGWRYMEAAPEAQSIGIKWYNGKFQTTGATATGIGSGKANTAMIISKMGPGSYAASLCDGLVLGGYDDWFLPSKDELNLLYINLKKAGRGSIETDWYWSSSEHGDHDAWAQDFADGFQNYSNVTHGNFILAVRFF